MKIITKGNDFQYQLNIKDKDGDDISITMQNYYKILIYTDNPSVFIDVTNTLNAGNVLSVDCNLFRPLNSGQIHIKVMFSENNPDFMDGKYDYLKILNTEYYYQSETKGNIAGTAQWGLLYGSIEDQTDLVQYIKDNTSDKDIVGLTQAEYDYLVLSGNVKSNNLYVITDNN